LRLFILWEAQFVTVIGIAPTLENQATPNKLLKSGYGILAYQPGFRKSIFSANAFFKAGKIKRE
jgi:hypothetical protein